MADVYLGLGANLGDPLETLKAVKEKLFRDKYIENVRFSRFYRTSPVSDIPQDDYVNAVASIRTSLSAKDLLKKLKEIEKSFGKKEQKLKNAPRLIDIDILFYGDLIIQDGELQVPHPRWQDRLFVVEPLLDLVSAVRVPVKEGKINTIDLVALRERLVTKYNHQVEVVKEVPR